MNGFVQMKWGVDPRPTSIEIYDEASGALVVEVDLEGEALAGALAGAKVSCKVYYRDLDKIGTKVVKGIDTYYVEIPRNLSPEKAKQIAIVKAKKLYGEESSIFSCDTSTICKSNCGTFDIAEVAVTSWSKE